MARNERDEFAETSALLAVLDGDRDEARHVLEDFFPTELKAFAGTLETLSDLVDEVLREKSGR